MQRQRLSCDGGARLPKDMIASIDDYGDAHGVEPICRDLPIAPSTYHDHIVSRADPPRLSGRAKRDAALRPEIARVFAGNFLVYGARRSGAGSNAKASMWPGAQCDDC